MILRLIVCALLLSTSLSAQIGITYNDNIPTVGDSLTYATTLFQLNQFDEGQSGQDVSWDYSGLTDDDVRSFVVENAPDTGMFSFTDLVYNYNDNDKAYYRLNGDTLFASGIVANNLSSIPLSDPKIEIKVPFTYNDSLMDTYQVELRDTADTFWESGTQHFKADAYGTLVTPADSFDNVLRIRNDVERTRIDQDSNVIIQEEVKNYAWINQEFRYPLLSMSFVKTMNNSYVLRLVRYQKTPQATGISQTLSSSNKIKLYPNPSKDVVTVESANGEKISNVTAYDIAGNEVLFENISSNKALVNLSDLNTGVYTFIINTASNSYSKRVVIK